VDQNIVSDYEALINKELNRTRVKKAVPDLRHSGGICLRSH